MLEAGPSLGKSVAVSELSLLGDTHIGWVPSVVSEAGKDSDNKPGLPRVPPQSEDK